MKTSHPSLCWRSWLRPCEWRPQRGRQWGPVWPPCPCSENTVLPGPALTNQKKIHSVTVQPWPHTHTTHSVSVQHTQRQRPGLITHTIHSVSVQPWPHTPHTASVSSPDHTHHTQRQCPALITHHTQRQCPILTSHNISVQPCMTNHNKHIVSVYSPDHTLHTAPVSNPDQPQHTQRQCLAALTNHNKHIVSAQSWPHTPHTASMSSPDEPKQTQLQCPAWPTPVLTASTVFSATRNGFHNLELWLWRVQASNRDLLYRYSVLCVTNLICNRIAKFSASCRWMPSRIFIVYWQCWSERQFCKQLVVFVSSVGDVWQ